MADEELNPKMRMNPIWYQGWDYVDGDDQVPIKIKEDLDMNGFGIINMKDPEQDQDATTKKYVDDEIAKVSQGQGQGIIAANVKSTPTAQIQAENVQDAINEISQEGAFINKENTFEQPQTIGGGR